MSLVQPSQESEEIQRELLRLLRGRSFKAPFFDTDLLHADLTTVIARLATLLTHTDGLEGLVDGLEALATTLNGYVDGLEAGLAALLPSATATGTLPFLDPALSNAAVAVKAAAGRWYGHHFYNSNAAVAYVQVFNVAAAGVTLGTTVPTRVYAIPLGAAVDTSFDTPDAFSTAISIAATTTPTGAVAPAAPLLAMVRYI